MLSTDPIADMLSRIRNAVAVRKESVSMPHSKNKETIARLLSETGFIKGVQVEGKGLDKRLIVIISDENENAAITEITRLSKPGRRLYAGADEIPTVKRGRGLVIISTSKGVMTGNEARKNRLGGELICKVY